MCTSRNRKLPVFVLVLSLIAVGLLLIQNRYQVKHELNVNNDLLLLKIKKNKLKQSYCMKKLKPINKDASYYKIMHIDLLQKSTKLDERYSALMQNETRTKAKLDEALKFYRDVIQQFGHDGDGEMTSDSTSSVKDQIFALKRSHADHLDLHVNYKEMLADMHRVEHKLMTLLKEKVVNDQKIRSLKKDIFDGKKELAWGERTLSKANRTNAKLNGRVEKLDRRWDGMWHKIKPPLHPFSA